MNVSHTDQGKYMDATSTGDAVQVSQQCFLGAIFFSVVCVDTSIRHKDVYK